MTQKLGIRVTPQTDQVDVVNSDIVITATTSRQPVFNGKLLKEGTHVTGIGSHYGPGAKELDEETIKRAKVVVDQKAACLKEAGDIIDPIASGAITSNHIYAELRTCDGKKARTNRGF